MNSMIQLPGSALTAIREALYRNQPQLEAAGTLREAGLSTGADLFRTLGDQLSGSDGASVGSVDSHLFWERLSDFFSDLGWGRLTFEQLHPGVGLLQSEDWAEASSDAASKQPMCHITTGVLAEVLSQTAGADVAILEVECRSKGDSRCAFLVGGEAALGSVHSEMTGGADYMSAVTALG